MLFRSVVVSNGPLVEIQVDPAASTATAKAQFFRPLEKLEIVRNGAVAAAAQGDGKSTTLTASFRLPEGESSWVAARAVARREPGEPEIQGHTNPVYVIRDGRPVMVRAAREKLAGRWEAELNHYRSAGLPFATDAQREEFFRLGEKALAELRRPLTAP